MSENASELAGLAEEVEKASVLLGKSKAWIGKRIIGQEQVVEQALVALLCGGHALLVGAPGLAKTRLVETLGVVFGLNTNRVQFTPDLMPADILGSEVLESNDDGARARVLGLAAAILLAKAGESVGLMEDPQPPKHGRGQITKMAMRLVDASVDDYGVPPGKEMARGNRALLISDFLGDWDRVIEALSRAADQRVQGCLVQVLDPTEESFPFDGRTIFESMGGGVNFETRRAKALRDDYLARLAERKDQLDQLARRTGWMYLCHHTDQSAQTALMWVHNALAGAGR